jgi:pSer/pThr/pTyr-binding forkhead associated (FHA) protein
VRSGGLAKPASITFDAPRIVLGRGDGCEVLLPDPSVSQRHASIRQRGTDYVVIDEGSANGTFVGQVRLSPHAPRVLKTGDLLRLGRIWLEIRVEQARVPSDQMLATREIALDLVASALTSDGVTPGACIRVESGPDPEVRLALTERQRAYVIGRGVNADLSIEDDDISRRHVEVGRRGLGLSVTDLGSKNGSSLDGKRLEKGVETQWNPGSVLEVGGTKLVYDDPVRAALEAIESAPDERMHESDVIAPPDGVVSAASVAAPSPGEDTADPPSKAKASVAPVRAKSRLPLLDVLVGLVALVVLGVSLFGLWILFGS